MKKRLSELSGAALISVLLGCSMTLTLMDAFSIPFHSGRVILWSGIAAFFCITFLLGRISALLTTVALSGGLTMLAVKNVNIIPRIKETAVVLMDAVRGVESSLNEYSMILMIGFAVILTLIAFLLSRLNGGIYPAILMFVLTLTGSWFADKRLSAAYAVPGLIALAVMYARAHRTGIGYIKAIPAAVIAALLAVWLLPVGEVTWDPLKNAAEKVQELFNDYFMFTDPRTVYSVSSDGYQPQGETLGGPATPRDAEIMKVKTDRTLFLRGSVRKTYTGHSWVDDSLNSRYLFVDPTRQTLRESVFDVDKNDALEGLLVETEASISILNEGTSTLFIPHRLQSLSLPLELAAYYNDSGEVFITRGVQYGDHYDLTAWSLTGNDAQIREAIRSVVSGTDPDYYEVLEEYMNIPAGLDDEVYWLTQSVIEGVETPYEKARAIQKYLLQGEYRYTLDVDFPPTDRDFVSYFLLESREGYCTYYASAMAVMARLAGLPSRYVEGYLVPAESGGETLVTGDNAHAWVEIYFEGVGWISFDPTPGDDYSGNENGNTSVPPTPETTPTSTPDRGDGESGEYKPETHETVTPEPTITPTPDNSPQNDDLPTTPTPDPNEISQTPPVSEPPDPERSENDSNILWRKILIWIATILLFLLLTTLMIRWRWRMTDPSALSEKQENDNMRMMLWYRAVLDLLRKSGFAPEGGETPEAFARRLVQTGAAPEQMIGLTQAVQRQQYACRAPDRTELELAQNVYRRLLIQLPPKDRFSWYIHRLLHGMGNFHQIP